MVSYLSCFPKKCTLIVNPNRQLNLSREGECKGNAFQPKGFLSRGIVRISYGSVFLLHTAPFYQNRYRKQLDSNLKRASYSTFSKYKTFKCLPFDLGNGLLVNWLACRDPYFLWPHHYKNCRYLPLMLHLWLAMGSSLADGLWGAEMPFTVLQGYLQMLLVVGSLTKAIIAFVSACGVIVSLTQYSLFRHGGHSIIACGFSSTGKTKLHFNTTNKIKGNKSWGIVLRKAESSSIQGGDRRKWQTIFSNVCQKK